MFKTKLPPLPDEIIVTARNHRKTSEAVRNENSISYRGLETGDWRLDQSPVSSLQTQFRKLFHPRS